MTHRIRILSVATLFASLLLFAGSAHAYSSYFTDVTRGDCASCHVGQTGNSFCGNCHSHGTHSSSAKSDINVTGTTNKTTYAPGETVSVTIAGGYRPSQARAILYNQNGAQLAISTGTPSVGGGPVNAPVWPVTLSAPAPTAAGTYSWKVAWYGNQYDAGGAMFGTGWTADTGNSGHGWQTVSTNSFTVSAPPPPVGSPKISVSPASDSFGSVTVGSSSTPAVTTISNIGTASLAVSGMTLSDTADYSLNVNGGTSPCGSTTPTLAAGANCTVAVTFSPKSTGTLNGSLSIASNDTTTPTATVSLSGTGLAVPAPKISVSPASDSFGSVTVGSSSSPAVTTISNIGTASLAVSGMTLSDTTDYSLNVNGGTTPCGSTTPTLAAGANCTVAVTFSPKSTGTLNGSLSIASNDTTTPTATVSLSGTGAAVAAPKIAASPTSLSFGNVTVGSSSAAKTVTLSNTGNAALAIGALAVGGADASEFALSNDRCSNQTVAPSANCTVGVIFSPSAAAAASASLNIPSNDPSLPLAGIPLTGTGVAQTNTPPSVVSTVPVNNATNVNVNATVSATFSETVTASTVNTTTFTLAGPSGNVGGTVTYSGTTAVFTPSAPLANGSSYTATITQGVKDLSGLSMAAPYTWKFTTIASSGSTDTDDDGVKDDDDDYPDDNRRATPPVSKGHGKVKIDVTSVPGAYLKESRGEGDADAGIVQVGKPAGYHFDYGMVSFKVYNELTDSTPRTMNLTFPDTIPAGSKVYMATATGFREVTDARISGDTVTLPVRPQGTTNSVAVTTGSPSTAVANVVGVASPDATSSPSGGGCSVAGTGGGWKEAAGSCGFLFLAMLGLGIRRYMNSGSR